MPYKVDFKQLATEIDIADVADLLKLKVIKGRAHCPVCDSERAIQLYPETNSFCCHSADISGDCISLYAHVNGTGMYKAALVLQEQFQTAQAAGMTATTPPRREARTAKSQPGPTKPERAFDPDAFAAKLAYSPEVEALGISSADAERLGIGWHAQRKAVYFPVRNPDGSLSGFIASKEGQLVLPPKWIASAVVPFKKRA